MTDKIGKEVTYTSLGGSEITGTVTGTYGDYLVVEITSPSTGQKDEELMLDTDKSKK